MSRWRVEHFDGVFGGWYATDGDHETQVYPLRLVARLVAFWRNVRH
jgi:hypothetical protein